MLDEIKLIYSACKKRNNNLCNYMKFNNLKEY